MTRFIHTSSECFGIHIHSYIQLSCVHITVHSLYVLSSLHTMTTTTTSCPTLLIIDDEWLGSTSMPTSMPTNTPTNTNTNKIIASCFNDDKTINISRITTVLQSHGSVLRSVSVRIVQNIVLYNENDSMNSMTTTTSIIPPTNTSTQEGAIDSAIMSESFKLCCILSGNRSFIVKIMTKLSHYNCLVCLLVAQNDDIQHLQKEYTSLYSLFNDHTLKVKDEEIQSNTCEIQTSFPTRIECDEALEIICVFIDSCDVNTSVSSRAIGRFLASRFAAVNATIKKKFGGLKALLRM